MIMAVQALTSRMTQAVLSVKSMGKQLPDFKEYEHKLRYRWIGKRPKKAADHEALSKLIGEASENGLIFQIDEGFRSQTEQCPDAKVAESDKAKENEPRHHMPLPWQKWFFGPDTLLSLLHPTNTTERSDGIQFNEFEVPLDDLRSCPFIG